MKDYVDKACGLELPPGLESGIKYNQNFVKAKPQGPYPCNYSAEKVPVGDAAMKMSLGK